VRVRATIAVTAGVLILVALLPAAAATRSVTVGNFSFGPTAVEAAPGDEIVWTWAQGTHTVTAWSGDDFDSLARSAGQFSTVFGGGVVRYRCELHSDLVNNDTECSGMCGVIGEAIGAPEPPVITEPSGEAPVASPFTIAGASTDAETIVIREGTQVRGQANTDPDGRWSLTMSLPTGSHTLQASAQNALGVESSPATLTIQVDATAPTITLTAPGHLTVHTGEVGIAGEGSDAGTIAGISVTLLPLVGAPIDVPVTCTGCGTTAATFTATVDPPPGVWTVTAKAIDAVGNEGAAAPSTIVAA